MTREHDCHVLAADALFRHGQRVPVGDPTTATSGVLFAHRTRCRIRDGWHGMFEIELWRGRSRTRANN
jgi:hypothetical protein